MAYQNFFATRLFTDAGAADSTLTLETAPSVTTGTLVLEARNPTQREIVTYTGVSGNQVTGVTRGVGGTTAKAHIKTALVEMNLTAEDLTAALGLAFAFPTGIVMPYAGSITPSGWLACDGSAVNRTTYAALFTALGTTFGVGNGSTTFNLPDMRGRSPVGVGASTKVATFASRSSNVITVTGISNTADNEFQTGQAVLYTAASGAMTGLTHNTTYYLIRTGNLTFSLATSVANAVGGTAISLSSDGTGTQTFTLTLTTRTLGETGGEEDHANTVSEMPSHSHPVTDNTWNATGGTAGAFGNLLMLNNTGNHNISLATTGTGGSAGHNNMQPFVGLNYIIKT